MMVGKKAKKVVKKQVKKAVRKEVVKDLKTIANSRVNSKIMSGNSSNRIQGNGIYSLPDAILRGGSVIKDLGFGGRDEGSGFVNKAVTRGTTALGNLLVPGFGDFLGKGASSLAKWIGFGDYHLKSNSMMANCGRPNFGSKPGSIRFAWTEFVIPISYTSSNFQLQNFLLNPGNPSLFPFLNTIAQNFENFEFHGLIMHYDTTSSVAFSGSSPAVGQVTMATDYDVLDVNYPSIRDMEVTLFATTEAPYDDQYHAIECKRSRNVMNTMYIQPFTQVSQFPDDPRFSCLGNFQIATTGIPYTSGAPVIGNLYVTYDVSLSKPQLATGATSSGYSQHSQWDNVSNAWVAGGPANSNGVISTSNSSLTPITITGTGSSTTAALLIDFTASGLTGAYMISIFGNALTAATLASPGNSNPVATGGLTVSKVSTGSTIPAVTTGPTNNPFAGFNNNYSVNLLVKLTSSGAVSLPVASAAGQPMVYDIYIASIAGGPLSGKRFNKNRSQLQIDETSNRINQLEQTLNQFLSLKNSKGFSPVIITEQEDDEYEAATSTAVNFGAYPNCSSSTPPQPLNNEGAVTNYISNLRRHTLSSLTKSEKQ